jgi:hypothetical protein
MKMNKHEDMPDPEKIKEILDVVAEKVPGLLKELSGLLYSPDSAKQYAEAAATFYKELIKAGMSNEQAFNLTSQYLSTLNLGSMMGKFAKHHEHD